MLLVYVDDILCVSHNPARTMDQIKELYRLKDELVGPPKCYLGANISQFQLPHDVSMAWSASAHDYIKSAICNIEDVLANDPQSSKLRNQIDRPLPIVYCPEIDVSPLPDAQMIARFQIGMGI